MDITHWPSSNCATRIPDLTHLTSTYLKMSRIIFVVAALTIVTMAVAQEVVEEVDGEGRTFGHLAKPFKKLTNKFGHYLVHATSDYYPGQYYAAPVHHHGGYYGGAYGQNGLVGFHRPGYLSGFV